MIELTFLKELILIRQSESKECDTCHYWYFLDKGFNHMYATDAIIY